MEISYARHTTAEIFRKPKAYGQMVARYTGARIHMSSHCVYLVHLGSSFDLCAAKDFVLRFFALFLVQSVGAELLNDFFLLQ